MRYFNTLLFLLVSLTVSAALKTEKVNISFSEDDFQLSYDDKGCLMIAPAKRATLPACNEPCLPLFSTDVAVSADNVYISSYLKFTKRLIRTDVRVAQTPSPVPTNCVPDMPVAYPEPYDLTVYPASNCNYVASSECGDITVLHFLSCPFVYDAQERNLYFIDSIELEITLGENLSDNVVRRGRTDGEMIKSFVENPDAVDSLLSIRPAAYNDVTDPIDYVIITKRSLVPSFEPLLKWKRIKGLHSKIVTMEDIEAGYEGADIQVKLKKCLRDLKNKNDLQYVLLGGDDAVVPVRGCYGEVKAGNSITRDRTIPTDLYYACFGKNFEWDGNNNGIYGETDDNINLYPDIYVTRVPVRTPEHVTAFVNKILSYEKGLHWNNNILMCGDCLSKKSLTPKPNDAEMTGDSLYFNYIAPYWNGKRVRFYNTATDFSEGANYELDADNLAYQMSLGYSFMDMITHGLQCWWNLENEGFYSINEGMSQNNCGSTIITTTACLTNAFDESDEGGPADPCLSESLIRNSSSGVVAYLGCSRVNWLNDISCYYGADFKYESAFYENLFSNSNGCKNYGRVVADAKKNQIGDSSNNGAGRWVQFGLNPIGDPEMPIFISEPKHFERIESMYSSGPVIIDANHYEYNMCAMSADDDGASYYKVDYCGHEIPLTDLPVNSIISITSHGYIPDVYKVCLIQNETISDDKAYDCDIVKIADSLTSQKYFGPVVVKSGTTTINASDVIIDSITVEQGAELVINNKE